MYRKKCYNNLMIRKYAFFALLFALIGCNSGEVQHLNSKKLKVFEEFKAEPNGLQAVQERSRLRAITYFNSMSYFIANGKEMGFEYNLAREFADWLGVDLEIVVPPSASAMYDWLQDSGGDIIIAPHLVSTKLPNSLKFSDAYSTTSDVIMTPPNDNSIHSIDDLKGRVVYVIRKSRQHDRLEQLNAERHLNINIKQIPEDHSDEELLDLVQSKRAPAIAIDGRFASVAQISKYPQLHVACTLTAEEPVAWVVAANSDKLRERLNQYISLHYRQGEDGQPKRSAYYNILYRQYFSNPTVARWHDLQENSGQPKAGRVASYAPIVRTVAREYGLDWRLLLAVIYQESNFNPNAQSIAGARGLMQLLPDTFASLGFGKIYDTEQNIRAGASYLKQLMRSYANANLTEDEKLRFVLASYNAGASHLADARQLATKLGWQDTWYGGIQQAFKLLMDERYYKQVEHGYCRGIETTRYVSDIMDRYALYKKFFTL